MPPLFHQIPTLGRVVAPLLTGAKLPNQHLSNASNPKNHSQKILFSFNPPPYPKHHWKLVHCVTESAASTPSSCGGNCLKLKTSSFAERRLSESFTQKHLFYSFCIDFFSIYFSKVESIVQFKAEVILEWLDLIVKDCSWLIPWRVQRVEIGPWTSKELWNSI